MIFPWQRKDAEVTETVDLAEVSRSWAELVRMSQMNTLSLLYMMLTVMEDPEVITDDIRDQVIDMVEEMEYGIARFEEFLV